MVICTFIIYKKLNKTSTQPILKSNFTSFIFNKNLCEIKGKKVIDWGGPGGMGNCPNSSWKCNFAIYLDIQATTTLLCPLLVRYVLVPSIYLIFYLKTARLKSDICRHSKAYSSHNFQPTCIELGSLWRKNRSILPIISAYLYFFFFF